jgi:hypothetical protein
MCRHFTVYLRNYIRRNIITTEPEAGDARKAVMLLLYIHNKTGNENCTIMGYYAVSSSISYRRFGTTLRSHLRVKTLQIGPKRLRNSTEECSFHPHCGGNLKSRTGQCTYDVTLRRVPALLLWKSNKHYTSCIVVALGILHAVRMCHIVICGQPGSTIFFPHYLIRLLKIKRFFLFSLQLLYETFLILRKTERDMIQHVHWSSCKVSVILLLF